MRVLRDRILTGKRAGERWRLCSRKSADMSLIEVYLERLEEGKWVYRFGIGIGEDFDLPDIDGPGGVDYVQCEKLTAVECYKQGFMGLQYIINRDMPKLPIVPVGGEVPPMNKQDEINELVEEYADFEEGGDGIIKLISGV